MKVIDWLEKTYGVESGEYPVRPFAFCKDGYGISIQGGDSGKYCEPRRKCDIYHSLELGFPTEEDELINSCAEDPENLTDTVYGYVDIYLVEDLIEKHGGIDFDRSIISNVLQYAAQGGLSKYATLLKYTNFKELFNDNTNL